MKRFLFLLCIAISSAQAQETLTIETALNDALQHHPVAAQEQLIRESEQQTIAALNRNYLPQIMVSGQMTTQSDVTELPITIPFPGFSVEPLSKDQYRAVAEVQQPLFDGGTTQAMKSVSRAQAQIEESKRQVEWQKVRDRVRQLYLGILMADEQIKQLTLVDADLQAGVTRMQSAVQNGIAFRSQLAQMQAEQLRNQQRRISLTSDRQYMLEALGMLTGKKYTNDIQLQIPIAAIASSYQINRPELRLFDAQNSLIGSQRKNINSKVMPRLFLFGQSGYGRPGLNMLDNNPDWFYLGGAKLQWNLGALYSHWNEKSANRMQERIIASQREAYTLGANMAVNQFIRESEKLNLLLQSDAQLIALREEIMRSSKAQLDNGVITSADYIREVNAVDQARQQESLHRLQLVLVTLEFNDYTNPKNNP